MPDVLRPGQDLHVQVCPFVPSCLPIALCAALFPSAMYSLPMFWDLVGSLAHSCINAACAPFQARLAKPAGPSAFTELAWIWQAPLLLTCSQLTAKLTS